MADVLRPKPWRSAELAGDLDVAGFADGRLLHPHLFCALRRSVRAVDRLARGLRRPLLPFEDARGRRLHSGRGTEVAMDRRI
jgi:hypothetical protein